MCCLCFTKSFVVFVPGCVQTQLQEAGNQEMLIYSFNEQFHQDQSNTKVSKIIGSAFAAMADRIEQDICWVCSALSHTCSTEEQWLHYQVEAGREWACEGGSQQVKMHKASTQQQATQRKSPILRKTERPNEKLTPQCSWWELMLSSHRQHSIQRRGNSQSRGQKAESLLGIRRDELVRGRQAWQQVISLQRSIGEARMNDKEQSDKECLWGGSMYNGWLVVISSWEDRWVEMAVKVRMAGDWAGRSEQVTIHAKLW